MKKWNTLFVSLLFAAALLMAEGCSNKEEPTKPAAKVVKPSEAEKKAEGAKLSETTPAAQIVETIKKYMDAFNANDLDTVMTCFSNDAIYQPGDGKTHRGKAEIRAAFEPQFNGAWGALRWDEHDRIFDAENRKMAIRYVCRVDISNTKLSGLRMLYRGIVIRLFVGKRFGWQGVDVFHFDVEGKIAEKYSYTWYGSNTPHLQPELG